MKFRLIDIDLDGTALLPDRIHFSQRLLEALEKAHQSGVHILPATGRQYSMLPPVFREDISWKEYAIFCNGAEIRDLRNDTILSSYYIDPRQAIAVLETAKEYKAPMEIAAEGKMILTRDSYEWLKQNGGQAMDYHLNYTLPRFGQFVEDLESYIIQERPVMPLAVPAMASAALFIFLGAWNEFVVSSVLVSSQALYPLQVSIYNYMGFYGIHWGPLTAAATAAVVPTLIVFAFLGKALVSGLTAGAVKD